MPILSPARSSSIRPCGLPRRDCSAKGCRPRATREEEAREEGERKGGRGKRVGSRLERAARGQVATRNQGTSEPPSSHARNLQLPPRDIHTLFGADGRQASEPMNTPSKNAPVRTLCWCARTCTRACACVQLSGSIDTITARVSHTHANATAAARARASAWACAGYLFFRAKR